MVTTAAPVVVSVLDVVVSESPIEEVSLPVSSLGPSMAGVVCDQYQMAVLLCDSQIYILVEIAFELVQVEQEV